MVNQRGYGQLMENLDLTFLASITLATLFVGLVVLYIIYSEKQKQIDLERRLGRLKKGFEGSDELYIQLGQKSIFEKLRDNIIHRITRLKSFNKTSVSNYRLKFEKCGWDPRFATIVVPLMKFIFMGGFLGLYLYLLKYNIKFAAYAPTLKLMILVLFLFLGLKCVDMLFDYLAQKRLKRIERDFSLVIDLMVVCTESGLSFDRSLERIAQEIIHQNPDLSMELTVVAAELSILPERRMAYENFAKRLPVEIIKALSVGLIQAEEHGAAVGKTLNILSQDFMKTRLSYVEEKVGKMPSKLTLPMVLCGIPILLIIVLGPAAVKIGEVFSNIKR